MENPIYFSKVEFREYIGITLKSCLLLNLAEKRLSYQVFRYKTQMPTIQGIIKFEEWYGNEYYDISYPARIMKNEKTDFQPELLKTEQYEQEVVFSYGIKLSNKQMCKLLPFCNALDFEPFRDREMSMNDDGFIGYRDEVRMRFRAITNSHIPLIELSMDYYYDEQHIWPSEKLYRYLLTTFFENNRKTKKWITSYGGFSLFYNSFLLG